MKNIFVLIFSFIVALNVAQAKDSFDHSVWNDLLVKNVKVINSGKNNQVNYAGFFKDKALLEKYLNDISVVSTNKFKQWSKISQLSFLINAYNAYTVNYILSKWPNISSIKELGGFLSSPWSVDIVNLFDKKISLDDLEHEIIRKKYPEPRVHFALNCASIGCPSLRAEAYTADLLNDQLEEQVVLFLSDRSRNGLVKDELVVSPIFKWYKKDFIKNSGSVAKYLAKYASFLGLNPNNTALLQNDKLDISYSDYDWDLNVLQQK